MPTARRSRTLAASQPALWELVGDPHHLPRWWPRVSRVEDVDADAFTEVMSTAKGAVVRADFRIVEAEEPTRLKIAQQVRGTPFARVLRAAETEVRLEPAPAGSVSAQYPSEGAANAPATLVTIELRQTLSGFFPRLGFFLVRRAANTTLEAALDGLERIVG